MKTNNKSVILTNVGKKYEIHHEKPTFIEKITKPKGAVFWALKNINLSIKRGERLGIIGPNGSGKTTLLKIITGIASPTEGKVVTNGRIISLIDLEAGFHPDLTGLQNIYLNGAILGLTKREIKNKISAIIKFADIGKFINIPLFTYSQGMKLRLGFSIAIHANPDILILDENVSVGDQDFSKKSTKVIEEMFKENKTIIIASHEMNFMNKNCDRIVWINKGVIKMLGKPKRIIDLYERQAKDDN